MDKTEEKTDWGIVYRYIAKNYRYALYMYDDDPKTIYLSNVRVEPEARQQGLGRSILFMAEREAKKRKADTICLKVLKEGWVRNWYARHGYSEFSEDEDPKFIWMKHEIK